MGWNGGTWEDPDLGEMHHKGADGGLCKKFINHAIKELDGWIRRSGEPGTEYHPHDFDSVRSIYTSYFFLNLKY